MSKSWQILIIMGFIILGFYVGFDIYNSITGNQREFNQTITPVQNDLKIDVLTHINLTEQEIRYKGYDPNENINNP